MSISTDSDKIEGTTVAQQFRARPIVVEAMQWTGQNFDELKVWLESKKQRCPRRPYQPEQTISLPTYEFGRATGYKKVALEDWIVCYRDGQIIILTATQIEQRYSLINEPTP